MISPYSIGCQARAPLAAVSTLDELEAGDFSDKVLLVRGELAKEQLMPKNFPFYNPEEHRRIVRVLEDKKPIAILAATRRDPQAAGAVYPFPLIEDGDFDIPSVFLTAEEGIRLALHVGEEVQLQIRAARRPSSGCNVIATKGRASGGRVVLFAHIDAKEGTPGALDNATGTVVLLLLAELLADYDGGLGVELVAMNGEDYYAAPGEQQYLANNAGKLNDIVLGINIDGVGYCQGGSAYSLYECPPPLAALIQKTFAARKEMVEGEPWYQGDHSLFVQNQVPALAITSERFIHIWTEIAHTSKDRLEIVDTRKLVVVATLLRDLLMALDRCLPSNEATALL
jgi:aminopeptidase YwaD